MNHMVARVAQGPALQASELVDEACVVGDRQIRMARWLILLNNTKCTRQDAPGTKEIPRAVLESQHTTYSMPLVWPVVIRMR